MKSRIGHILIHPVMLVLINCMIFFLGGSALMSTWFSGEMSSTLVHEVVEAWEGFGTILVGFGVMLEERPSLGQIFGVKFHEDAKHEQVWHDYGVIFVVLGVLIEIFAWLVKIPNEVLDTHGVETALLNIGCSFALIYLIMSLFFTVRALKK